MKKTWKMRLSSFILAMIMVFSSATVNVYATENEMQDVSTNESSDKNAAEDDFDDSIVQNETEDVTVDESTETTEEDLVTSTTEDVVTTNLDLNEEDVVATASDEVLKSSTSTLTSVAFDLLNSGCDYYNLISKEDYNLAPGAMESEIIINDDTGSNRNVLHVIEVDLKSDNISVMPTYMGLREGIDFEDSTNWGSQVLTEQAAHVENDLGLNVVGGINTNLRYDSDHPYGVLVWNGVVYSDERNSNGVSTAQTYLVVDKEGNAELRSASEPLDGTEWQAISANFGWILKDGVSQYTADDHADASRAPRTVIGIKDDGTLVLMMNDGRQAPYSAGTSMRELAEILLSLGCVDAVNCDGGGSSTFISEREGTGELTMKSSPSDGGQRATLGGLLVISKAVADGNFHHATVKSSEEYVTPGSVVEFVATGADSAGGPADVPADVTWQLADSSFGTVENGVFTSSGKTGEVIVQMLYNGEIVGQDSVTVVIPEAISFAQENMTVPFGKVATLTIKATVNNGLNEVALKEEDISIALSDDALGSISGFEYTSCEETAGVSNGTITATLTHDVTKTAVANLMLGKGSEVVWDFEDGDISSLSFGSGYQSKHPAHPELGRFESGYIEVVDSTTGQVKNGEKALAVVCDWSNFYAMGYNMLRLSGLNVDLTDAVRVGFWMYITPEATGVELDFENWYEFNHGDAGSDAYPVDGWYYVSVDATKISESTFNNLNIYQTDGYDSATANNIPNIKTKHTLYIDDITVDYSTVVEDREAPEFTGVSVLKDADTYVPMEGQTVTSDTITVFAEAKENTEKSNYTGLDTSSAKVFVDGVELTSGFVCASNGSISVDNIQLSDGIHTFSFEIADNAGNTRTISRQIVIDATNDNASVSFVPQNPDLNKLPIGSMYWMDINVENIETIESVNVELNLDGSNEWQLDHMVVTNGFTAEYSVDDHTNDAILSINRTGNVVDSGNATLVSIPIHVWEYTLHVDYPDCLNDGQGVCNFISTPAAMWSGDGQFRIAVCVSVERGEITYTDNTSDTFSSEKYVIDTEMDKHRNIITQAEKNAKTSWHIHTPVAIDDKAATCTESGYTGRTVCAGCSCGNTAENPCDTFDGCGSVVDWGTTIPATGHTYEVVDGKLVCECGDIQQITGLTTIEDELYYCINGVLKSGWIVDGENYYYFDTETYAAKKNGTYLIDNYEYTFDENGIHTKGQWIRIIYDGEYRMRYKFAGNYVSERFATIDGNRYWFGENGLLAQGTQILQISDGVDNKYIYVIDETGIVEGILDYTGVYNLNGTLYYVEAGKLTGGGVREIDNNLYYVEWNGVVKTGKVYIVEERTNGLLEEGWYFFDENGKMYDDEIIFYEDSSYYIQNGQPALDLGVTEIGGELYFIDWNGKILSGKVYVSSEQSNDLVNVGWIYSDSNGRLYNNEYATIEGSLYYMIKGQPDKTGITGVREIDGSLYFVEWNGKVVTGKMYISEEYTNGLVNAGWNYSDESGRLYDEEFATIDGNIYYMSNGQPDKTGVSTVRNINGSLYFVEWNGKVATGKTYINEEYTGGLVKEGWSYTDETGRMYHDEFAEIDGNIYYMLNGQPNKTGVSKVSEINGSLYFVEWNGKVATGKIYINDEYTDGLIKEGWSYTNEAGKLYNDEFAVIDGCVYYMVKGQPDRTGVSKVRKIGDSLYFVEWNGKVATGKTYINEEYTDGLINPGWTYSDEMGRMYDLELATVNNDIYYMVKGQPDKTGQSGVREIENSLYFVEWNGKVATGKVYINEEYTNDLTTAGWHYTDETGRMYNEEFVDLDENRYYIVNGQIAKYGVFEVAGELYYANTWNGKVAVNENVYISIDDSNELIHFGWHEFDSEGKMIS